MKLIENRKAMAGQGGFTLIELLVVIAILAVLAGAAVIGIGSMRDTAQTEVCNTDAETLETAAEAWALAQPAAPATGDTVTVDALVTAGLIKEVPRSADATDVVTFSGANATATITPAGLANC